MFCGFNESRSEPCLPLTEFIRFTLLLLALCFLMPSALHTEGFCPITSFLKIEPLTDLNCSYAFSITFFYFRFIFFEIWFKSTMYSGLLTIVAAWLLRLKEIPDLFAWIYLFISSLKFTSFLISDEQVWGTKFSIYFFDISPPNDEIYLTVVTDSSSYFNFLKNYGSKSFYLHLKTSS